MSPPRGVTSPLCCCVAGCSAGCKPGTPFPGGKGKLLLFFWGFVFFPNLQLTGGNSQRVRRKRSLAPLHGFPFIYFFYYRTDLLGRKPPHLLTKHLLNLPAVPPCPFPCINLPDYHCRPRTEREPSPSSGHLLHHLREADALPAPRSGFSSFR